MKVKDIMTRDAVTIDADASVVEAAKLMRDKDVGSVVILDHNEVKGIVTDRKIVTGVVARQKDPSKERIGDISSKRLISCNENSDVHEALVTLGKNRIRRCPVVNDKKELVGVVSIADVAKEMRGCMDALFDELSMSCSEGAEREPSRAILR